MKSIVFEVLGRYFQHWIGIDGMIVGTMCGGALCCIEYGRRDWKRHRPSAIASIAIGVVLAGACAFLIGAIAHPVAATGIGLIYYLPYKFGLKSEAR